MISLFLDTASAYMSIGIYRDCKELYLVSEASDNHLSERLLPAIRRAFDTVKLSISEIDRVYIVNGPGSFTGVRIGVTVAKTICWGFQKEIIPISELELFASTDTAEPNKLALIDARRGYVYAGIYDEDLNVIMSDVYISLNDLFEKADNSIAMIGVDSFSFETMLPKINVSKIIQKHQNDTPLNPHQLIPNYLKKTEAEEKHDSVCQ